MFLLRLLKKVETRKTQVCGINSSATRAIHLEPLAVRRHQAHSFLRRNFIAGLLQFATHWPTKMFLRVAQELLLHNSFVQLANPSQAVAGGNAVCSQ